MASDAILAEALLRIEHKLDILIRSLGLPREEITPLHFTVGQSCPICLLPIEHVIDIQDQVAKRRCGCSTGKVPSAILDTPEEVKKDKNGTSASDIIERALSEARDTSGRKKS
jgi:hypothetical protein